MSITRPKLTALLRQFPWDAWTVLGLISVFILLSGGGLLDPIRAIIGVLLVTFLPGYALLAVLFPERHGGSSADDDTLMGGIPMGSTSLQTFLVGGPDRGSAPPFVTRVALSVVLSVAVVSLSALAITALSGGFRAGVATQAILILTAVSTAIGGLRRAARPLEQRFIISVRSATQRLTPSVAATDWDILLNAVVIGSMIVALATLGFAFVVPAQESGPTAVSLVAETDTGAPTAGDYAEADRVVLRVEPLGSTAVTYSVVVRQEQLGEQGAVLDGREVARSEQTVSANETWQYSPEVPDTATNDDTTRMLYLVYEGQPPADPTMSNADHSLYFYR
jgi:uncharacterized membrane protein